jgi:hypothetical protein
MRVGCFAIEIEKGNGSQREGEFVSLHGVISDSKFTHLIVPSPALKKKAA